MIEANVCSPQFEPKEAGQAVPGPGSFRLGFSWSAFFYPGGSILASRRGIDLSAQSRTVPGSRKPSVPGRVHSIPKSYGSQVAVGRPGSNPLLTHDTVESPAKRCFLPLLKNREPPPPINPQGSKVQPLCWLAVALEINSSSSFNKLKESRRVQSVLRAPSPTPFAGSRRLS